MKFPDRFDIIIAAGTIKPYINRTPVQTSENLNKMFNTSLFFKCENFQKAGAFKSRGACNAVFSLYEHDAKNGVATHSSGNFAQALSRAAMLRGIKAHIVMPENSAQVKIDAVKSYGGNITFCIPTLEARETTLLKVIEETGAIEIHPYDNNKVIAGNGTATLELLKDVRNLDYIIAPVGGGGLLSGTALAAHYLSPETKVIAAEPEQANDAFKSFYSKEFVPSVNPNTIADGLRTSLGQLTFPIILKHVQDIFTVSEADIIEAMQIIWERMKIIIEPSSAVCLAAVKNKPDIFTNKNVGIILSGGNVDLKNLPW